MRDIEHMGIKGNEELGRVEEFPATRIDIIMTNEPLKEEEETFASAAVPRRGDQRK